MIMTCAHRNSSNLVRPPMVILCFSMLIGLVGQTTTEYKLTGNVDISDITSVAFLSNKGLIILNGSYLPRISTLKLFVSVKTIFFSKLLGWFQSSPGDVPDMEQVLRLLFNYIMN